MRNISTIEFHTGSKEELLPDFAPDFPYIASHVAFDNYFGNFVPWHWHKAAELFYIQSGTLEYYTPKGKMVFPAGSGGMVNSNVLHMTRPPVESHGTVQLLHIFDSSFIAGEQGSRIEQNYIIPIIAAPQLEIIALYPDHATQAQVLNIIRESFHLSKNDFGYEVKLRTALSDIWLHLLTMSLPFLEEKEDYNKTNDKIKQMMIYIHEHYTEKISIAKIAAATFSSERECFRAFHNSLHMTPVEYIQSYRLQMACHMLAKSQKSITFISQACGFGSSSYFGKVFRDQIGCTPIEYRKNGRIMI
ncbi:MAG: helix-turn-helix transcriptional regulator [Lachnospiraceae bacterium]|nr:helix-turn-helix transcriptional regulator [Lachnospiraceae bacterium]